MNQFDAAMQAVRRVQAAVNDFGGMLDPDSPRQITPPVKPPPKPKRSHQESWPFRPCPSNKIGDKHES